MKISIFNRVLLWYETQTIVKPTMTNASVILDKAWRQIDKTDTGYIYGREFELLIDAIDSVLEKSLLNDAGKNIIKRFSDTDGHRKIYRSDFKTMFESLIGITFSEALEAVQYDKGKLRKEKALEKLPILTSTPNYDDSYVNYKVNGTAIDPPNFRKEFKKFKRLSESKDEEIRYRDEFIDKLEIQKKELESNQQNLKELQRLNTSLEQDVLFRDDIILARDREIREKEEIIRKLEREISSLHKEVDIYKSDNANQITQLQLKKKEKFNDALLERVKQQEEAIEKLKAALSKSTQLKIPKHTVSPKTAVQQNESLTILSSLSPLSSLSFKLPQLPLSQIIIPIIIFSLIIFFTYISPSVSQSPDDKWYTNTFLEPFIFNLLENREIDYDYYRLNDVDLDFEPR